MKATGIVRNVDEMAGKRYGSWTVVDSADSRHAVCRCDCGNVKSVDIFDLIKGKSTKCMSCAAHERSKTHGMSKTRLYSIWKGIKRRCYQKNCASYSDYGSRGISVCPDWLHDFRAFYDWSMANGYNDTLSIDRIDNDGNYEPGNCRWATRTVQNNNTRRNHYVEYQGEMCTLADLSRLNGMSQLTIYKRLQRGWSVEEALTIKLGGTIHEKHRNCKTA